MGFKSRDLFFNRSSLSSTSWSSHVDDGQINGKEE